MSERSYISKASYLSANESGNNSRITSRSDSFITVDSDVARSLNVSRASASCTERDFKRYRSPYRVSRRSVDSGWNSDFSVNDNRQESIRRSESRRFDRGEYHESHDRNIQSSPSKCDKFMAQISPVPDIKPEPYSGEEPWEEYFSYFEDCAELCRWDKPTKVLFLCVSLRDKARRLYMSLDSGDKRDYEALVYRMQQRFGKSQNARFWLNQLETRQRKPGESITALCDDLWQLSKKGYGQLDRFAQETIALNHLYKIIPREMQCRCVDNKCTNLQEAAIVIERYESIMGDRTQCHCEVVRAVSIPDCNSDDSNIVSILQKLDTRLEKLENVALVQRRCFSCNSLDHLVRDCPNKVRNSGYRYYQPKPRDESLSTIEGFNPVHGEKEHETGCVREPVACRVLVRQADVDPAQLPSGSSVSRNFNQSTESAETSDVNLEKQVSVQPDSFAEQCASKLQESLGSVTPARHPVREPPIERQEARRISDFESSESHLRSPGGLVKKMTKSVTRPIQCAQLYHNGSGNSVNSKLKRVRKGTRDNSNRIDVAKLSWRKRDRLFTVDGQMTDQGVTSCVPVKISDSVPVLLGNSMTHRTSSV